MIRIERSTIRRTTFDRRVRLTHVTECAINMCCLATVASMAARGEIIRVKRLAAVLQCYPVIHINGRTHDADLLTIFAERVRPQLLQA